MMFRVRNILINTPNLGSINIRQKLYWHDIIVGAQHGEA